MSAVPWLIGGAALGAAVLLVRNRQAKEDGKLPGGGLCALAEKLGLPKSACETGVGILGGIVDAVYTSDAAKDAENRRLNGEVELVLDPALAKVSVYRLETGNTQPALKGTVLRFKNGGVPFKGFPGWEKCAPGTHSMLLEGHTSGAFLRIVPWPLKSGASSVEFTSAMRSLAFSGKPLDPFTRGPLSDGSYFIGGKRVAACGAGQVIEPAYVRAWGTDVQHKCAAPGKSYQDVWGGGPANSSPTPQVGTTVQFGQHTDGGHVIVNVGGTGTPSSPPPGYHWVPATPTVPGHWERDMAPK